MPTLSRRDALRSVGLAGLGLGLAPLSATATPTPDRRRDDHPAPFYQTAIGDTRLTVVQDAALEAPLAAVSGGAPEGAVEALFAEHNLPTDAAAVPVTVALLQRGDRTVLLDTGLGDYSLPIVADGGGRLLDTLAALGVRAEDVDTVVISHMHPDHIGAVTLGGAPVFPNAAYLMPEPERAFVDGYTMTGNEEMDGTIQFVRSKLDPLAASGQLDVFAYGDEVVPGLTSVAAPGHTPGHSAFLVADGDAQLMLPMDAANHYVALFHHPEWLFAFDAIPEQTVATRRALLGRAADDGLQIWGPHLPFPGLGYVVRRGEGFQFVPAP